jgi:hypothetical protein
MVLCIFSISGAGARDSPECRGLCAGAAAFKSGALLLGAPALSLQV